MAITPPRDAFYTDQPWLDDKGLPINAHGGGLLFHDGLYYWFGEHKPDAGASDEVVYRYTLGGVTYERRMVGETSHVGVHCYSSKDLYNWKDEGIALANSDDPSSDIVKGCIIERPKVIYNRQTRLFVMWFHLELKGQGRRAARSGIAVSEAPAGPYRFIRSGRPNAHSWPINVTEAQKAGLEEAQKLMDVAFIGGPNPDVPKHNILARDFTLGQMAKDMNVFVDDDGTAFQVYSAEENSTLHLSQLTDDYLGHSGKWIRLFPNRWHEAPALFKHQGRYWMLSSNCTGWDPNTLRLSVADSIWGPWQECGNPMPEMPVDPATQKLSLDEWKALNYPLLGGTPPRYTLGTELTFGGQSTQVFRIQGFKDAFIALFDIWRPKSPSEGGYMWLPVTFNKDQPEIHWKSSWNLSVF